MTYGGPFSVDSDGKHTVTFFSKDNVGNVEALRTQPINIDQTPPVLSGLPSPGCSLWPPNQKLVTVGTVNASDALSGLAAGSLNVTGASNEATNDPRSPDVVITPGGSGGFVIQLRADRLGGGNGRTYTLNATANDLAGNTAAVTATCTVPHDQGK
jgi:hypothetical protein